MSDIEVEHPDEMPKDKRARELDPDNIVMLPEESELPIDEPVSPDKVGKDD